MVYKNYLTTPSGRYCEISELVNADYLILIKYLQAEHFSAFFKCLNEIVKRDLPDFDDYDIVEKCYVYFAYCMYSIRATITVHNMHLGDQEINIALILNNIETSYVLNRRVTYKLDDKIELEFGYPKSFSFSEGTPVIDFFSGLISINGMVLDSQQKEQLKEKLNTKTLSFIDDYLRESFHSECDVFHGVPMNSMKINIVSESLIANVVGFFKMPLDGFYQIMYVIIKHLRMSYSDFMKINQIETMIMLNCSAEENKRMAEDAKKGDISTIGRQLNALQ